MSERFSTEIAIDLEHHSRRSFLRCTCLIQMSSRSEDIIFDVFKIWSRKINNALAGILVEPAITNLHTSAWTYVPTALLSFFVKNSASLSHVYMRHPGIDKGKVFDGLMNSVLELPGLEELDLGCVMSKKGIKSLKEREVVRTALSEVCFIRGCSEGMKCVVKSKIFGIQFCLVRSTSSGFIHSFAQYSLLRIGHFSSR